MVAARLRRTVLAFLLVAAAPLLLDPAPAAAQPKPESSLNERQELARMKAQQGLKLFGADRWQEAFDWFREADVLFHAPTLTLYMARCQRKMGKLLEARALYDQILAEPLPADPPPAYLEARDAAAGELGALRKIIPTVQIAVTGAQGGPARVTLDGKPFAEDRRELNPGNYTVEAQDGSGARAARSFTLQEGTHPRIELAFQPAPGTPSLPPPAPDASPRPAGGSYLPGAITLGVGAVGLGIGAITGVMSLNKVSDIKSRCNGDLCPRSEQANADGARTLAHVSTATLVLGGACAVAGAVLLVVRPRGHAAPANAGSGLRVSAILGPGRLDLQGSF
jgi:hypothetical protein